VFPLSALDTLDDAIRSNVNPNSYHLYPLCLLLLKGYAVTAAVETLVLIICLSKRHSVGQRIGAGIWLNACSYPAVVLTLPRYLLVPGSRWLYVTGAEGFAVGFELLLFFAFFGTRLDTRFSRAGRWRDGFAIVFANLCSFLVGEVLTVAGMW